MRQRILCLLKLYATLLVLFVVQKPLFMLYHHSLYADTPFADWLQVMLHGVPLDLSVAGYLSLLPALMLTFSIWGMPRFLQQAWNIYLWIVSLLMALIFTVDLGLYSYWGFRLDATPLFYFFSSPKDALASATVGLLVLGVVAFAASLLLCRYSLRRATTPLPLSPAQRPLRVLPLLLLSTGLLFLPIRGGVTVSTMNTGKAYFSPELKLNHAATNPAFSLLESLSKQKDFARQYRFMEAAKADSLFLALQDPAVRGIACPPADTLFSTRRPDVLFLILESFSSRLLTSLGGEPDIAVEIDSLCHEGVLFTHLHANSFRTDRGLVALLSGYPAQPTTSIMKYPRKTQHLPSLCASLRQAGYQADYYYGGDADFTNMRSYLRSSGFQQIVCDQDFPVGDRLSKWGVHDHLLFDRLYRDLEAEALERPTDSAPRFRVLQTSSSHEPFEVPYRRLANDRLNAFAYTDSCVGDFIRRFRRLPQWRNSVVVLVPDHLGCYPEGISNLTVERYEIPLLMIGGAIRQPRRIDTYGSQHDLAATLLAQLDLPHDEFLFSKDLLCPAAPHFAFFTVPDAVGMVTSEGRVIYDCQSGQTPVSAGATASQLLTQAQAYLQKLYDDLAAR